MSGKTLCFVAAAMLAVTLAGCGGRQATPEGTFQTYQDAVAGKDWRTALSCLTPEAQDKIVAGLLGGVATASVMNQDAAALMEKHGVDRNQLVGDFLAGALANLGSPGEAIQEGMRQAVQSIADKPAFVGDAVTWLEQNGPQQTAYFGKVAEAQLSDVQIEGDVSTGKLSVPITGSGTSIRFKKIDGRWLIDF